MKVLPIILFILLPYFIFSQSEERNWDEGRLTWDDFKGEAVISHPASSILSYYINYKTDKLVRNDTTFIFFKTSSFINQKESWVKDKSPTLLKYNQVIFDLVEAERRYIYKLLYTEKKIFKIDERVYNHYTNLNSDIYKFYTESEDGSNEFIIKEWERKTDFRLNSLKTKTLPNFSSKKIGWGLGLGIGTGIYIGEINELFATPFNLDFGIDLSYSNHYLLIYTTMMGQNVKNDFTLNNLNWSSDLRVLGSSLELTYGYAVINKRKNKIVPFGGISLYSLNVVQEENETMYDSHRYSSSNLIIGIMYDFKIKQIINLIPSSMTTPRGESVHSIRFRIYNSTLKLGDYNGNVINVGIGYKFYNRGIKLLLD